MLAGSLVLVGDLLISIFNIFQRIGFALVLVPFPNMRLGFESDFFISG